MLGIRSWFHRLLPRQSPPDAQIDQSIDAPPWEQPPSPYLPGDNILVMIALVAGRWSLLERLIDLQIWEITGLKPSVGACITSQIQSVRQKLIALEALVQLRGGDQAEKTIRLLRRFQNAAEQPARMRNRVVHNPMARKDGQAKLWRLSADRKLIFEYENITWDELRDIMDKINDLITDFENIFPPNVDAH